MKYKNVKTGVIVEPQTYSEKFAYSHNSEWTEYKEVKKTKEDK